MINPKALSQEALSEIEMVAIDVIWKFKIESADVSPELDAKVRELDPAADLYTYDKLPFMDKDNSKDTDDDSEESKDKKRNI